MSKTVAKYCRKHSAFTGVVQHKTTISLQALCDVPYGPVTMVIIATQILRVKGGRSVLIRTSTIELVFIQSGLFHMT